MTQEIRLLMWYPRPRSLLSPARWGPSSLAWNVVAAFARGHGRWLRVPALLIAAGMLALAAASVVIGVVLVIRRLELSPRTICYHLRLAQAACTGAAAVLGGLLCWLADANASGARMFRAGAIDTAGLTVVVAAAAVGLVAVRRAGLALAAPPQPGRR